MDGETSGRRSRELWQYLVGGIEHGPLPAQLLALTVITGVVDSVSILRLGRVFVANMTGNVVFVAFGLAGAKAFSVTASLVALGGFLAGIALVDQSRFKHRGRAARAVGLAQLGMLSAATAIAAVAPNSTAAHYVLLVLLSVGMGIQNTVVRGLGVPDITTTVLTLTLTGLVADVHRDDRRPLYVRGLSVTTMFLGALIGATLALHEALWTPLLVAAAIAFVVALTAHRTANSNEPWTARR